MRAWIVLLAGVFFVPAGFGDQQIKSGQYKAAVVELYTSEGCSSCPPADKFLSGFGKIDQADLIIPLAFHVDYWDHIGWKDPYANADYTQRQRAVARVNHQSTIYTPEFVVDGVEARGSREIADLVSTTYKSLAEADITLKLSDIDAGKMMISVDIENVTYSGDDVPEVYLAVFESGLSSSINAGENQGRTLDHDFVVRYLSPAQTTVTGQQHIFDLQLDSDWDRSALGVTAIVRLQKSGRTLQAVKGML